jgi:formylglycine-generating enzyme required for sulfatase activity
VKPAEPRVAVAAAFAAGCCAVLAAAGCRQPSGDEGRCGRGFVASGAHCVVRGAGGGAGTEGAECPPPLVRRGTTCDAPEDRVLVPETTLGVGPSDWEAEGLVEARTVHVAAFRLDAFEVTEHAFRGEGEWSTGPRAATRMTREAAEGFCRERGGRLPTEDEWIAAAAAPPVTASGAAKAAGPASARRYPWGETGAVCRRAAWGLLKGPCATGGDGPDAVGSRPDGDGPLGLHDLAGNAAEWVAAGAAAKAEVAKGGSWQSALASELRTWARLELPPGKGDPRVGFRCAYPP